jgi:cysteine desulfurase
MTTQNASAELAPRLKLPIYMDNQATTPVDPRVLDEMMPYFTERFGNAASRSHEFGWMAEEAVERARARVARVVGASAQEIIFTSGATESDNLAIKGVAEVYQEKGNHIITVVTEHKAVLDSSKRLEKHGHRVTYLPVGRDGLIDLDQLKRAIDDKTTLVSVMYANNEIGVLQPVAEIGEICRARGVLFHSDAAQAAGKVAIDVNRQNIDLISISGHKMYGPKGVGALYVREKNPRVQISAIIDGGGHERGMRSGTLNVPGIVGLGKACEIALTEMREESVRLTALRDRLKEKITSRLEGVSVNGTTEHRLPGNLNMSFLHVEGESLLMGMKEIALSSGAACTSAKIEPSYVLKALGLDDDLAQSTLRFGLGRFTTEAEVDYVADKIVDVVKKLRDLSPANV